MRAVCLEGAGVHFLLWKKQVCQPSTGAHSMLNSSIYRHEHLCDEETHGRLQRERALGRDSAGLQPSLAAGLLQVRGGAVQAIGGPVTFFLECLPLLETGGM